MMGKKDLVSIVIPVYNGEKYLRKCLDSIIGQTYQAWELLLIDDGSSDSSGDICDEYAAKNEKIKVLHKENGGQASARNTGLTMAQGEYVSFVDCDDWLDSDMYSFMTDTLRQEDAEAVICGYVEEYDGWQKRVNADGKIDVYDADTTAKMLLKGQIGSYLWSMLFKRDIVREQMPDLNPYEDHATVYKWLLHANKVVTAHHAFYHYRQLQSSSLHSYDHKKGNHFFLAIKDRYDYISSRHLLPGWEAENRRLYLRGCIKLTKDLARMPDYDEQMRHIIDDVRLEIRRFLPITRQEMGLKYYIRQKLLLWNVDAYVRLMRFSSLFSLSRHTKEKGMQK